MRREGEYGPGDRRRYDDNSANGHTILIVVVWTSRCSCPGYHHYHYYGYSAHYYYD